MAVKGKAGAKPEEIEQPGFEVVDNALIVRGEPSFEAWQEFGDTMAKLGVSLQWGLGDWCNVGEARYGEKYAQALDITGRSYEGLRQLASVSGRFQPSRRRDISWTHHRLAAKLAPEVADKLLDKAVKHSTGAKEFGEWCKVAADKARQLGTGKETEPVGDGIFDVIVVENLLTADADVIKERIGDHAIIGVWCGSHEIERGLDLMNEVGAKFADTSVWVRDLSVQKRWLQNRHDLLMFGIVGTVSAVRDHEDSVIAAPVPGHSGKPDEAYAMVARMIDGAACAVFMSVERPAPEGWTAL